MKGLNEAFRKWLQWLLASLVALLACFFVFFRVRQEYLFLKWQVAVLILLFFVAVFVYLLLMYDSWFLQIRAELLGKLKAVFFLFSLVFFAALSLFFTRFFV